MLEKTQVTFKGTIGTNNPNITKERLIEKLLSTESAINEGKIVIPVIGELYRIHIFSDEKYNKKKKDENKTIVSK